MQYRTVLPILDEESFTVKSHKMAHSDRKLST